MTSGGRARRRLDRYLLSRPEPALAAWTADRLWPAHGRRERWLRAGARRVPALARGLLGPAEGSAPAAGAVLDRLLASPPAGAEAVAGAGAWVLALPHREDRRRRLTAFLFPPGVRPGREGPDRVVKLRREDGPGPCLGAEGEALARLVRELPDELGRRIPSVLGTGRTPAAAERPGEPGWEVLVLSALPGRSAYVELQGALAPYRSAPGHLDAAVRWLVRFQEATARRGAAWSPPAWEALDPGPGGEDGGVRGRPDWHRRLTESLTESLAQSLAGNLAAGPVAPTAVHGDFWARNLLVGRGPGPRGGLLGVVDWEHFRPEGSPFEDLFTFATTCALGYPWGGRRRGAPEALERAFLRENGLSRALRAAFARYRRAVGLGPEALEGLFLGFLLERARSAAGRDEPVSGTASGGGGAGGPSTGSGGGGAAAGSPERSAWLGLYRRLEGGERSVFSG